MANAPFPIQPELTAVAIRYRNQRLIADEVLPRSPVAVQEFKYMVHTMAEGFTVPDTRVGRKGQPGEVEFTAEEKTSQTLDFGLDDPVPQADIDNAPAGYDPVLRAVEGVTDLILLDREVRTASLIFAAATYPSANRKTLSGSSQFSDPTSDPVGEIMAALDTPVMRPNIMVVGRPAFTRLATHPKIVKAVLGNAGDSGVATRRQIAEIFELDDVLVGEGFVNTARKGQAASMSRVWGKHIALLHRNPLASVQSGTPTFGMTAEWGTRQAGAMADSKIGVRGGQRVRVYESVREVITAPDLGFFLQDAVA